MEVYCQIAQSLIPNTMCADEQGVPECAGCGAATRQCTACGHANGIANPRAGTCPACTKLLAPDAQHPEHSARGSIEDVVERMRVIASPFPHDAVRVLPSPPPSPMLSDPRPLLDILAEHVVMHRGVYGIPRPESVLQIHAKLTGAEARSVLHTLAAQQLLVFDGAFARIAGLEAPPNDAEVEVVESEYAPAIVARPSEWMVAEAHTVQRTGSLRHGMLRQRHRPHPPTPWKPDPPDTAGERPRVTLRERRALEPIVQTFAQLYDGLTHRARMFGGERIIRGAVPALQVALQVGPRAAVGILEQLVADGHLTQRDGWRTVVLHRDTIADDRIAHTAVAPRQRFVLRTLRVVGDAVAPAAPAEPAPHAFADEITKREEALRELQAVERAAERRRALLTAELEGFRSLAREANATPSPPETPTDAT